MPSALGCVRRLVLAPSLAEVTFARRGFPPGSPEVTERLEAVPQAVVCGFEWGMESRDRWELDRRLELVEPGLRGFAYEGATMALTIRDATGRSHRTRDLLLGSGRQHIFLAYIGIGFAMARLPRVLWKRVLPDLSGSPYHPVMSWLAVDGYGFDRAYFDTGRWVDRQWVPPAYPWQGVPDYFPRAVDQGIGRALWFIHAARVTDVAQAVAAFAGHRRPDLWSGVGLAAAFAGGCTGDDLRELRTASGEHWAQVALGAVFAARARAYADFVPAHTEVAVKALADLSVPDAVAVADHTAVDTDGPGPVPAYESWRRNIRSVLVGTDGGPGPSKPTGSGEPQAEQA